MELFGINPGRRVIIYFMIAIIIGTILLKLSISAQDKPIDLIDALFTSTSAVCVTGLTVVDTGKDFSLFGQIVILILIQFGGLGIMTFATALLIAFGSKLTFQDRLGLTQSFTANKKGETSSLIKAILSITLSIELIGALAMFLKFKNEFPVGKAIFYSIFHSVSAFCNAGFSIFSNSLENYRYDYYIIIIFAVLIIIGGLGFTVIRELFDKFNNRQVKISLHSKLCLLTTAILLIVGTIAYLTAEYQNVFQNSGAAYNTANAFFQSVTSRTAGFNTISQNELTEVSMMITIFLMFVGACPGSTGGGIKTITFMVILLLIINRFSGRSVVTIFKRTISGDSIIRAITVFILAFFVIAAALAIFMFAEEKPLAYCITHGWFGESLFEIVSAFSTVGLSLGMTSKLHDFSKIILIITMFTGRVGLLTLAFAFAKKPKQGEIVYSEESVMTG
ncbi:MAG: hypothetical protein J7K40_02675 [candidate division Zixibacteria bacterium]|nr:hypothetical protein [candidate division Zixibacteria bacterium]